MAHAFVFPGQGSQSVGMGHELADAFPVAREVFEEVDDALERRLSKIMWDGPMDELTQTANAQPALMAHSVAMMRVLEKDAGYKVSDAMFVAGHSLGEYSALCAAGALSLSETAKLLRVRGEAMQAAAEDSEGAMAALIGVDRDGAQAAIDAVEGDGVCQIANDNAPGQIVISGSKECVEAVATGAKEHGAKMAKLLPVSGAFHSALMEPAAEKMKAALEKASIKAPAVPLVANVTATETVSPDGCSKRQLSSGETESPGPHHGQARATGCLESIDNSPRRTRCHDRETAESLRRSAACPRPSSLHHECRPAGVSDLRQALSRNRAPCDRAERRKRQHVSACEASPARRA